MDFNKIGFKKFNNELLLSMNIKNKNIHLF